MRSIKTSLSLWPAITLILLAVGCNKGNIDPAPEPQVVICSEDTVKAHKNLINQLKNYKVFKSNTNKTSLQKACSRFHQTFKAAVECKTESAKENSDAFNLSLQTEVEACTAVGAKPPEAKDLKPPTTPPTAGTNPPTNQPPSGTGNSGQDSAPLPITEKGVSLTVLKADLLKEMLSQGAGLVMAEGQLMTPAQAAGKVGFCHLTSNRGGQSIKAGQSLRFTRISKIPDRHWIITLATQGNELNLGCVLLNKNQWSLQALNQIFVDAAQFKGIK